MIASKPKLLYQKTSETLFYLIRNQVLSLSNVAAPKFENSLKLPSLPVPILSQSIEKYIKTVTPFLSEAELNNTKKILKEFSSENGIGTKLQKLLVQKAQNSENWLADWWLNNAYLGYRDPVVIYSSPGLVFPFEDFINETDRLTYTAQLILAAVEYKKAIYSDKIPVDKMGKEPLDMNQYKQIFGTCRIPGQKLDGLEYNSDSRHIVIVKNNNFFKLEVINRNGEVPSLSQLINHLEMILLESAEVGPPIGVLSTENRDNWNKAYTELIKDPVNKKSVDEIQKSLFLVALDNPMPELNDSRMSMASKQFIHGGGSRGNSANRWFDKTVQFIIGQDGTVGLTYEHSPSEGQPIAVMTDYLVDYIKNNASSGLEDIKLEHWPEKLEFNVSENVSKYIQAANIHIDKLVDNLDMDSFKFTSFGKEFVKSQKLSPDSFLQIAMQYAFYRIHKVPGAHYESAATRKYIHGRTETIRSCSIESIAFAKAMLDTGKSDAERVAALKEAIASHKKYSIEAVNGFGVDRHFLGLKLIALENGLELPEIYSDPSFTRSTHMRLSTSQVATKCDGFMCYAPLTADGYGCCYNPRPHDINFGVSAFAEHPDTSAKQFREALESSLLDMHNVLAKTQKAKL
ncbi:carnitine O-acetyltransferase isoform X2 [Anoplophora glabripennis]|nr:carnitine O-acetyltransferase isoform X2 [Anoplophora glabripennis]